MMVRLGNFLFRYRNCLFPIGYAGLFLPSPRIFDSYLFAALAGLAVCLAGQGIRVMTIGLAYIIRGGSHRTIYAKDLVTTGIFSHARNPLYVGNILILLGLGIMADSVVFCGLVFPVFLVFYQAIVRAEEAFLLGKFGDEYARYTRTVNRWLPRFGGLGTTLKSMEFRWKRVIVREYNATYIWMAGAVLLVLKNSRASLDAEVSRNTVLPGGIIALGLLTVAYFTIMHLKKSKRLRDA